jgi:hypothetical protein
MKTKDFTPGLLVYYKPGNQHGYVSSTNAAFVFVNYFGGNTISSPQAAKLALYSMVIGIAIGLIIAAIISN